MAADSDSVKYLYTSKVEYSPACGPGIRVRFRRLVFDVCEDKNGEYLSIAMPCSNLPEALDKALKDTGLSAGQRDEVRDLVWKLSFFNAMKEHIEE